MWIRLLVSRLSHDASQFRPASGAVKEPETIDPSRNTVLFSRKSGGEASIYDDN
jgi:hypothetical protein